MKNILLATDLTSQSDRATERAIRLAGENNATLSILHVIENYKDKKLQASLNGEAYNSIKENLRSYKYYKDTKMNIQVHNDSNYYSAILDFAHKTKADLIVMGMHGKTKIKDLFIGTTVERVVSHSSKPVLVVKNKAPGPYFRIVAGIDYSPASISALRFAAMMSPEPDITVLHTYHVGIGYPTASDYMLEMIEKTEEAQQHILEKFAESENTYFKRRHSGFKDYISYKLGTGSVSDFIIKEAKKRKAQIITMGAHGSSMLIPTKLGGYAKDVLSDPPCDVLVVRE